MLRSEDAFPNGLSLLIEWFSFSVATLLDDLIGQTIQAIGKSRILFPWVFLEDGNGSAVRGLRLGMAGLSREKLGKVTESTAHLNMFRPKRFLQNGQGLTVEWLGLGITTLNYADVREVSQAVGDFWMLRCDGLRDLQRTLR